MMPGVQRIKSSLPSDDPIEVADVSQQTIEEQRWALLEDDAKQCAFVDAPLPEVRQPKPGKRKRNMTRGGKLVLRPRAATPAAGGGARDVDRR
jgi:hypothetical protein